MRSRKTEILLYGFLAAAGLVFFFLIGEKGYLMGGDSELYINFAHYSGVNPVYPLFIQLCRLIFGNAFYLDAAAAVQGLLALVCCMIFVRFLDKRFRLSVFDVGMLFLFSLMPYAIELPGYVISHELMTEGLSYPLFYIYVIFLLKAVYDRSQKDTMISLGGAIFLALIRPQMQILFAVSAIVFLYVSWTKKGKTAWRQTVLHCLKVITAIGLILVTGMMAVSVIGGWYESYFFGGHAQDSSNYTIQARVLYASDEDDDRLFEDEDLRRIYQETYATMKEMDCTYHTMPENLWTWKSIVGCSAQNSRIVQANVETYLREEVGLIKEIEIEQTKNKICGEMTDILLKDNWPRYLYQTLRLMPSSLIACVLFQKESIYLLCHIGTAILYLMAAVLIIAFYKNKHLDSKKAELLFLVTGTAVVNATASNLILFGLQRYMVYTYGMFYIAMYLAVCELWKNREEVFKKHENASDHSGL